MGSCAVRLLLSLAPASIQAGIIIVLLAGCATVAQKQSAKISETLKAADARADGCFASIRIGPELQKHIPADLRQASLFQMTDTSRVSSQEIELLSERRQGLLPCRTQLVQTVSSVAPTLGTVLIDYYGSSDQNLVNLVAAKISWGEYIANAKALNDNKNIKLVHAIGLLDSDLRADHEREVARRQAALSEFQHSLEEQQIISQNQQIINNMNLPITTSCNRFYDSVNCTSY